MLAHVVLTASHNYTRNIKDFLHCRIFRVCITCLKETGYYVLDFEINDSTRYFLNKVVSKRSLSNHLFNKFVDSTYRTTCILVYM